MHTVLFAQICTMMLALGTITKKDVCEFRRVLEKSACLLLSEKGVPADERRQFEEILAAMESADEKTLPALDRDFHTMLLRATGNSLMVTVLDAIAEVYQKWIDIVIRKTGKDRKKQTAGLPQGDLYKPGRSGYGPGFAIC